MQTLQKNK